MVDVHNKKTRSYNMSCIRSKNTTPEKLVRSFIHAHGFRYKLHEKSLRGKPDIVLPKYNTIIDIRGCYFHRHERCRYATIPKTRTDFYLDKFNQNAKRDNLNEVEWQQSGWRVIVIWADCQLEPKKKNSTQREVTLNNLLDEIKRGDSSN